jgi:hypothetical protein
MSRAKWSNCPLQTCVVLNACPRIFPDMINWVSESLFHPQSSTQTYLYYKDITSGSFVYRPTQSLLYFPDVQSKCSFSKCGCCGHQTVPLETPVQVRPFGLTMAEMAIIDHFRQHTKRLYEFIKGRPSVGYLNMYNISLLELHLRSLESIHAIWL